MKEDFDEGSNHRLRGLILTEADEKCTHTCAEHFTLDFTE